MRPLEADVLRLLSHMPLIDRLEAVAVSAGRGAGSTGPSRASNGEGLAASVPHALELIPSTRRYCVTAEGLRRLARDEGASLDGLLRTDRSPTSGGDSSWSGWTPLAWSTASRPPSRPSPTPSVSAGTAPCRWTPPSPSPTAG